MTAKIIFNLDNIDDSYAYERCNKSYDLAMALWDFSSSIDRIIEDGEENSAEKLKNKFYNILEDYNINLDKLCY
jgi:hypothetical protein